jgi:hypothetical protein
MKTVKYSIMTRRSFLISLCVLHLAVRATFAAVENKPANPVAPPAFPSTRYEKMMKKSPFAPATPAAAPAAPSETFANFYVTGVAKLTEGGVEKDFVTIQSRGDAQSRFSLVTGEPEHDGFTLVKVEMSDEIGKSKVTVKKGTETGVLEFDQANVQRNAAMAQAGVAQPAAVPGLSRNPLQPAVPRMPGAAQPRLPQPFNPANPANSRQGFPQIPQPTLAAPTLPQADSMQLNPAGGPQPAQPQTRRRRTVITAQPQPGQQ